MLAGKDWKDFWSCFVDLLPIALGFVEDYPVFRTPTPWMDIGTGRCYPVVIVEVPPVEMDQNTSVHHVGNGGNTNEAGVGPIHSLQF
jgi:hypothetical protein